MKIPKKINLLILLVLAGCATTDEYRVNSFSPKKGPYCPGDQYPVCDIRIGHTICTCTDPRVYDFEMEPEDDF